MNDAQIIFYNIKMTIHMICNTNTIYVEVVELYCTAFLLNCVSLQSYNLNYKRVFKSTKRKDRQQTSTAA